MSPISMNISPIPFNGQMTNSPYGKALPIGQQPDSTGRLPQDDSLGKSPLDDRAKKAGKDPSAECQTCKERKYQDGSDEMVSFKSAAHISPEAAASAVRAHEQEHVSNAYSKAATGNGKVIRASVTLHTAICPECGRSYVSGGTTNTQIKYYNEENPYQQDLKTTDGYKYKGMNINAAL